MPKDTTEPKVQTKTLERFPPKVLAERFGVPAWLYGALRSGHKWEDHWPEMTEDDFTRAVDAAKSISVG